jgi:hypothetical protein
MSSGTSTPAWPSAHPQHNVARAQICPLRGPAIGKPQNGDVAADLGGIDTKPGAWRPVGAPDREQVAKDGLQQIDRHDHVDVLKTPLRAGLLDLQGADSDEVAGGADHRRPAPIGMCGGCEERFVEHVLPIAGELLFGDDARGNRLLTPASVTR